MMDSRIHSTYTVAAMRHEDGTMLLICVFCNGLAHNMNAWKYKTEFYVLFRIVMHAQYKFHLLLQCVGVCVYAYNVHNNSSRNNLSVSSASKQHAHGPMNVYVLCTVHANTDS